MNQDLARTTLGLLQAANGSWASASGQLYTWHDEDLLDEGRARFHGEAPGATVPEGARNVSRFERTYRFWAKSSPWRLRVEPVSDTPSRGGPDESSDESSLRALIVSERRWWLVHDRSVDAGGMPPDRVIVRMPEGIRLAVYGDVVVPDPDDYSWVPGMYNLDVLLRPASLVTAFEIVETERTNVEGRAAIRFRAEPHKDSSFHIGAGGLAALGIDDFFMEIDAEYGIALAVDVHIDQQLARRHTITGLRVNEPVPPDRFEPPAGSD